MATQQGESLPNEEYTVGWICAVECELIAARLFLDTLGHIHGDRTFRNDNNVYLLGDLKGHNVVVATLPSGEYGISSATNVAQNLLRSFPKVRIGLMVGIAGGAPTEDNNIRLGDVVVGVPRNGNAGVLHYDFGKDVQGESFKLTAHLDKPPSLLLQAVSALGAKLVVNRKGITSCVELVLQKHDDLAKEYGRPANDRLYDSEFIHKDQRKSCAAICNSDPSQIVDRAEWDARIDGSKVFTGLIASADKLMKNALTRDLMAQEAGVLCFEMEAAGLANNFPCLVVRGICDYSDTHKNKIWQKHASMVAAAYATELLGMITPDSVQREVTLEEAVKHLTAQNVEIQSTVNTIRADQEYKHLKHWVKPLDTSIYQADAQSRRSQGSGEWLLENPQFQSWQNGLQNFLWLFGLPGCGKTILSSTVIEALVRSGRTCLYFYITFQDHATLSFNNILRSLVWQLCVQSDSSRAVLDSLYCSCRNGSSDDARAPSIKELREAFRKMLQLSQQVWLVIDALDEIAIEASKGDCKDVIEWITDMVAKNDHLFILVTSRDEEHIRSPFERMCGDDRSLSISGEGLDHDIERYIENGISASRQLGIRWNKRRDMLDIIKERLMAKADGMFRYVACQLNELEECLNSEQLLRALDNLPDNIQDTYDRIIKSLSKGEKLISGKPKFIRILQFLLYSERPFTVEELVDVITIRLDCATPFDPKERMPQPKEIALYCSSLARLVVSTRFSGEITELHLAHYTVREYLLSARCPYADDLEESAARASIAITCMSYIRRLELTSDPGAHVWTRLPLDRPSDRMYPGAHGPLSYSDVKAAYPLLSYGCTQFMQHTAATVASRPEVFDVAFDFLNNTEPCYTLWRQFSYGWPDKFVARRLNFDSIQNTYYHGPLFCATVAGMSIDFVKALLHRLKAEDPASQSRHLDYGWKAACKTHDLGLMLFFLERISMNDTPKGPALTGAHLDSLIYYLDENEETTKETLKLFLSYPNNWNDDDGFVALKWALLDDSQEIVRILIKDQPACVNWRRYGRTPLSFTLDCLNDDVTVLLLENGASWEEVYSNDSGNEEESDDVDSTTSDCNANLRLWQEALYIDPNGLPKTTQWLVSNKPDCFSAEDLNIVAELGNVQILRILLQGLNWSKTQLDAALRRAAGREKFKAMALLLRHGATLEPESGASQEGKKDATISLPDGQ